MIIDLLKNKIELICECFGCKVEFIYARKDYANLFEVANTNFYYMILENWERNTIYKDGMPSSQSYVLDFKVLKKGSLQETIHNEKGETPNNKYDKSVKTIEENFLNCFKKALCEEGDFYLERVKDSAIYNVYDQNMDGMNYKVTITTELC